MPPSTAINSDHLILYGVRAVGRRDKLIEAIRSNPKDVRFDDACKVAEWLGFIGRGGDGSHRAYSRPGEPVGLNFQNRGGRIKPYQARQSIAMIEQIPEPQ